MPAQNKADLLEITNKEFVRLCNILDKFDNDSATWKRAEDTSLKDVVAHRAHWINLFLGWYKNGQAGNKVYFPAKGYKWNQLKEYNEALRQQQADLSWTEARKKLKLNHNKLVKFICSHSNRALYDYPMKGANNDWTTGRWAEAAGPSHYRSASKFARQCLKDTARRKIPEE